MNFLAAAVAGLVGTLAMTILMYVTPMMGMPRMDIARMLGLMVAEDERTALGAGLVAHF